LRLYVTPFAPNAMRVEIFMLEKGIAAELIDVSPWQDGEYRKLNPLGQVPALELDDGELITESLTICQYLDAVSEPPPLFGSGPEERARIGMWERRAELLLFIPSVEFGHHTKPMFAGKLTQQPEWAKSLVPKAQRMIDLMGDQLEQSAYLADGELSAADLTAALGYFGLLAWGAVPPSSRPSIQSWSGGMIARPSFGPLRRAADAFKEMLPPAAADQLVATRARRE
jgi:glutathione S-transferase